MPFWSAGMAFEKKFTFFFLKLKVPYDFLKAMSDYI